MVLKLTYNWNMKNDLRAGAVVSTMHINQQKFKQGSAT